MRKLLPTRHLLIARPRQKPVLPRPILPRPVLPKLILPKVAAKQKRAKQPNPKAKTQPNPKRRNQSPRVAEGVPVKVSVVGTGEISQHVLYSATVEAEETIDIYARGSGLVRRVLVEEGERVREGQVLIELVDDELKLNEAEAKLAYQKLESQLKRKEELFNRQLLAKEEYEDLKINVEQSKIRWERAPVIPQLRARACAGKRRHIKTLGQTGRPHWRQHKALRNGQLESLDRVCTRAGTGHAQFGNWTAPHS